MHKALAIKLAFAAAVLAVSAGLVFTTISTYAQATVVRPPAIPVPADAAPDPAPAPGDAAISVPAATPTAAVPPRAPGGIAPGVPALVPATSAEITAVSPGETTVFIPGTGGGAVSTQIPAQRGLMQGRRGVGGGGGTFGGGGQAMSITSDGTSTIRRTSDGQNEITLTTTGANTTALVKDNTGKVLFDGPYTSDADKAKAPAELRTLLDRAAQPPVASFVFSTPGIALGRSALSLETIKQQLGVTDAEWTDMQERIKTIQTLQGYLTAGGSAPVFNSAAGSPDAANPILGPVRELTSALADNSLKPEDLDAKVTAVRAARIEVQDSLAKARHKLEDTLTPRQKAILVNLQILE